MEIEGERNNSALAVEKQHIDTGIPYASHAWLPFGLAAYATIAYEIYETLGKCQTVSLLLLDMVHCF